MASAPAPSYYEEQDLIRSTRTPSGWRDFDPSTVDRVILIQHLYAAGIPSTTIDQLLPCLDAPPSERLQRLERRCVRQLRLSQPDRSTNSKSLRKPCAAS